MFEGIDKSRFSGRPVGVITGGVSAERAISLETGRGLAAALGRCGYDVTVYDLRDDLDLLARQKPAAAVLGLHGGAGENGVLQGHLEMLEIPYTGSGVLASALAMDKARTKAVFRDAGVATPGGIRLAAADRSDTNQWQPDQVEQRLDALGIGYPVVVKPNADGSSVGVRVCRGADALAAALEALGEGGAAGQHQDVVVERYLGGPEYTVGFFDHLCLGSIEVTPADEFYDFEAKYNSDQTRYEAVEAGPLKSRLESIGRDAYNAVGCRGVARVDIKADSAQKDPLLSTLEINTIPGMTATSLVPKLAEARGIEFGDFAQWMLAKATLDGL